MKDQDAFCKCVGCPQRDFCPQGLGERIPPPRGTTEYRVWSATNKKIVALLTSPPMDSEEFATKMAILQEVRRLSSSPRDVFDELECKLQLSLNLHGGQRGDT